MEMIRFLPTSGDHLTPREIVAELDKYIVGQKDAKRAVQTLHSAFQLEEAF